jgi:hypothetical protein
MKINIELDDNDPMYSVLDSVVLGYLKSSLNLLDNEYVSTHPDDIKHDKKLRKALLVLIEYYGG